MVSTKLLSVFIFLYILLLIPTIHADDTTNFYITNISDLKFYPSEMKDINITISNLGRKNTVSVSVEILTNGTSFVQAIGSHRINIGNMRPQESKTVQFSLSIDEAAYIGVYTIPLKITYLNPQMNPVTELLGFGIRIEGTQNLANIDVVAIDLEPKVVEPGKNFSIKMRLSNKGGEPADNLRIVLDSKSPFASIGADQEIIIKSLMPDESATAKFDVGVDMRAMSGLYDMPFVLGYESRNFRFYKNTSFGIPIQGKPDIMVQEIITEPTKIEPGTQGLLTIKLVNTGTERAEDVYLKISGSEGLLTETHGFIGRIDGGALDTITFGIFVDPKIRSGVYGLTMEIFYKDREGQEYTTSKINELSVYKKPSKLKYVAIPLVLIIISVIFILLFGMLRAVIEEKKRGKNDGSS